jgi:hemolysin III
MSSYSPAHEKANTFTHFLGFVFGLLAIPFLVLSVQTADFSTTSQVLGAMAYGLGFLMVFGFSTLYHLAKSEMRKGLMKIWDHISIYYLIAGTYTPLLLVYAAPDDARLMLWVVWGFAAAGTLFKIFFTGKFRLVSTALYIAMGWLVVFSPQSFKESLPDEQVWWLAAGGVCYSIGVVFYLVKHIPYHHAIWHVWVLGGALCHFVCIWKVFG